MDTRSISSVNGYLGDRMPSREGNISRPIRRNKLRFLCANVRSIINKFDEFRVLVEDCNPDVVGITESWLNDSIFTAEVHIPGYVVYIYRIDLTLHVVLVVVFYCMLNPN